jgi:chromosomal replication initiator protein
MTNEKLWQATLAELELALSGPNFKTWFSQTSILKRENRLIEIGCPTSYSRDRIEQRHYHQVKKIIDRLTKEENELLFSIDTSPKLPEKPLGPLFTEEQKPKKGIGLFPNYTFESFVIGNCNNLAHAVALAIVEKPGRAYNPVFFYSGVGLGKTHLIQAVGNEILKKRQDTSVLYCTGESFTNELLDSIQSGSRKTTAKFRKKFRETDVLLIDDIQFIAGREKTQEEFFNTFNELYLNKKQIVLTSDKPPREIQKLEDRLSSRFTGGMIADMQAPDFDVRVAILRNKARNLKVEVPNEVIDTIAEGVQTNIRELEGTFNQVLTYASIQNIKLTPEAVIKILGDNFKKQKMAATPKKILKEVCTYYTIRPKDIKGKRRPKEIVRPRQVAMYLLKNLTELPLVQIGDLLGGRDHTTVMHGVAQIEKLMEDNIQISEQVTVIKEQICG